MSHKTGVKQKAEMRSGLIFSNDLILSVDNEQKSAAVERSCIQAD